MSESGMEFIKDNAFEIEGYIKKIFNKKEERINTVEFIRIIEENGRYNYVFIEAKSSFSRPKNIEDFNKNINDIILKFVHSLCVFSSIKLGINKNDVEDCCIPENFNAEKIYLYLIINAEWVNSKSTMPIKEKLVKCMPTHIRKIFDPYILVFGKETAEYKKLIEKNIDKSEVTV